ncbi:PucR family transcriptional regulator [Paenarthrobacter sp. YIM B13468]|uniref:PucR family transcriptional regulator n=1 Tax=Paenarthrobacter sp. YIM B13468 TaxID=3366295 RepID=UPI00366E81CB
MQDDAEAGVGLDPALALRRSERLTAALQSMSRGLAGGKEPGDKFLAEATQEARAAAQAGVDLLDLIHTYRVLQSAMWDVLLDLTTVLIPDSSEQLEVQKWVSGRQHDWFDVAVANIIDAYRSEQHRFFYKSEDHRLRSEVRDFIAGRRSARPSANYPFEGQHLSVVAWGEDPKGTIECAGMALNSDQRLVLESTDGAFLGWLAVRDDKDFVGKVAAMDLPQGSHLALGSLDKGFAGFKRSHQRAWRAYKIGRLTGNQITLYADVALESVFATNMQAVHDLVALQLGPILSDPRKDILCETLTAYFASGCNAVAAAAALQVHERTVAYRLKSVEERLGVDVADRHVELLVALRLQRLLRSIAETRNSMT